MNTVPPALCAAHHPVDNSPILIRRGQAGYEPFTEAKVSVAQFNLTLGISEAEANAMLAGSMFGWDCPAAQPPPRSNVCN